MKVDIAFHTQLNQTVAALDLDRQQHYKLWQELAQYYLPRRYVWLTDAIQNQSVASAKNPFILDGTGTTAARTLAAGMMNGITSPSRPWFRLRLSGFADDADSEWRIWLDEVTKRMLTVMAESNFYNALAIMYLDLAVFGTSAMLMYEDFDNVIHCYNPSLGEYYLAQDDRMVVNTFARQFEYRVHQVVKKWGIENCSETVKSAWRMGGAALQRPVKIYHLIEPNDERAGSLPKKFKFREYYWERGAPQGTCLACDGYHEMPGIFPRWELASNEPYGLCPAMDALGDVIQLQHETKKKAQGLDKMISPPVVADVQLQHRPTALMPNGITFISGQNNVGAKALYQINVPINELSQDIMQIRERIREIFHNDLFKMISQLDTVRSAAEIGARKEEKLVLLGSVLERFSNEALDPAINRFYSAMERAELLPEPPQSVAGASIEIQYVSILSAAQSAVGVLPTEQFLTLIGNVAAIYPKAVYIPNWEEILRSYGTDIGVAAKNLNSKQQIAQMDQADEQKKAQADAAAQAQQLIQGGQTLSQTPVGGGANALQQIIGG